MTEMGSARVMGKSQGHCHVLETKHMYLNEEGIIHTISPCPSMGRKMGDSLGNGINTGTKRATSVVGVIEILTLLWSTEKSPESDQDILQASLDISFE